MANDVWADDPGAAQENDLVPDTVLIDAVTWLSPPEPRASDQKHSRALLLFHL